MKDFLGWTGTTVGNIGELLALDAAGRQTGPAGVRAGGGTSR